jgi:signal transduction histidine kinase
VDRVSAWRTPAPTAAERQVAANEATSGASDLLLNRAAQQRSGRTTQKQLTKKANLSAYLGDDLEQVAAEQQQVEAADVDVDVAPMTGVRVDGWLVLSRIVRSEGAEHRQGVVLRIAELERGIETAVLEGSPLRPYVALAWDGGPEEARVYRAAHRFAEPFSGLAVAASLDAVPELAGNEALTIQLLALALAVAVLGGGLGLGRAVVTELEFSRRRSDFVAAVSHELKTPLTTIRMYAEMLRDGMVPTPERQREYHRTITAESDRLGRLIDNVLELARLERGGAAPALVVGEVAAIVREAMEIVRPLADKAGFRLELEAAPGLPPARVDRDALVQVVVNLVDNAVKFAAEGERAIRLELGVAPDGRVQLVVRDHGPGVPSGQQAKVFEPFYRGERELTRKTKGTGIGLALVRGLVERMGGEVAARNHPDGGFEVTLRLAAAR